MHTLYRITLGPARKPYQRGLLFTHKNNNFGATSVIGHFTVMDGSEGQRDLVLIQTFLDLLWKLFLKNTSKHKNNLIYIIKQEGLYQSKVTPSLASIHNCKMAY